MWNNRFRWNQKNEQEKSQELMRIIYNSSIMRYDSIEDQADMVENFIDRLTLSQNVKKEDIIEELYKRWGYIIAGSATGVSEEQATQKRDITPEVPKPLQAIGIRATDKYKKKDENTVKEVCELLSEGKNYSEIARELHIDRRTVKNMAVKYGFTKE